MLGKIWNNRRVRTYLILVVAVAVSILGFRALRNVPTDKQESEIEAFCHENNRLITESGQRQRYIVYDCTKARVGICGGWSDRMAGIMTAFIISILAKRHFLINIDTPCGLQDYIIPAKYDWRYSASKFTNVSSSYHWYWNIGHKKIAAYLFDGKDFNTYFKDDVIFLRMNWDFIHDFRTRPKIGDDIPWITKYHQADIYKHVFDYFFKPSPVTVREFHNQYKTQRKRKKIACAHLRVGKNPNMPQDYEYRTLAINLLWNFLDTLKNDEYDLFVASDTDSVKTVAKKRYPNRVIDIAGNITHIDMPGMNDPRQGFLKQLLDFYILVDCDILVISNGGFATLATFLRPKDYGLYGLTGGSLLPISRYTLNDVFPRGKFKIKPGSNCLRSEI